MIRKPPLEKPWVVRFLEEIRQLYEVTCYIEEWSDVCRYSRLNHMICHSCGGLERIVACNKEKVVTTLEMSEELATQILKSFNKGTERNLDHQILDTMYIPV